MTGREAIYHLAARSVMYAADELRAYQGSPIYLRMCKIRVEEPEAFAELVAAVEATVREAEPVAIPPVCRSNSSASRITAALWERWRTKTELSAETGISRMKLKTLIWTAVKDKPIELQRRKSERGLEWRMVAKKEA